jgi:hypothetical protein
MSGGEWPNGTPIGISVAVAVELFAAAHRRLHASDLPAPWRAMLEWEAVAETYQALLGAGHGAYHPARVWRRARPCLMRMAEEYREHGDLQVTMERLKEGPPNNLSEAGAINAPGHTPPEEDHSPSVVEDYVTLDQMAAWVSRSKRTLERMKTRQSNPLPTPDIEGGAGKADEWIWSRVRPWLEREFRRKLPDSAPRRR